MRDRRYIPLFLIVFIDLIGFGIVIPILLLHAEESFGASNLEATALLTVYSLGMVVAAPILGRLSDAFGRRPVLIVSQIGTLIGFLILGSANSLFLLYLGRIIDGLSGGNISTAQAYMNDITTEENRARGFGLISAAFGAGFIVGPALGGLVVNVASNIPSLAPYSQNAPFFVAALFSLASIIGTYFILPESLPPESRSPLGKRIEGAEPSIGVLEILKLSKVRYILSFSFMTFLAFSLLQASFALFARRNLFPEETLVIAQRNIGLLLTWVGVINVTMQSFFVGPLVRRFGEKALIVYATFGRIIAFTGIALARDPMLIALAILPLSVGNAVSQPSLQSILSRFASPESRGRILGIFHSTNSLTLIIGPIIAGLLLDLNLESVSVETITSFPMFGAAILVSVAFFMSLRFLRMELPTQERTLRAMDRR
jgi:DHA1 family tetracycline resistance protein-like MFS transporter